MSENSVKELDSANVIVEAGAANQAVFCGILQYTSDSGGWFYFKGIGEGWITANFEENGRLVSRQETYVTPGNNYSFDTNNYRKQLGFSCGRM